MFPWNRKEVYTGFSQQEFAEVQQTLSASGIQFQTRTVDPSHTKGIFTESRIGTPFLNQEFVCQHYVYVANEDYDRAKYLLSR